MEEILHQPKGIYPVIYNVLYIPGGAGFLPSTVVSGLHVVQRSPRGPLELRQFLPQAGQNRAIHAFSLHELFFKDLFFFEYIISKFLPFTYTYIFHCTHGFVFLFLWLDPPPRQTPRQNHSNHEFRQVPKAPPAPKASKPGRI